MRLAKAQLRFQYFAGAQQARIARVAFAAKHGLVALMLQQEAGAGVWIVVFRAYCLRAHGEGAVRRKVHQLTWT